MNVLSSGNQDMDTNPNAFVDDILEISLTRSKNESVYVEQDHYVSIVAQPNIFGLPWEIRFLRWG